MTTPQAGPQPCTHPGRDLAIVALSAALVGLFAFTVVMLLDSTPLAALQAGGVTIGIATTAGLGVLHHLKRSH
ncbi:hypothetical protein ACFZCG_25110 [Streptomyces tanashiensis]|uniref:hypothetical protein n=1 Tax=Streptomyces tanashiensis TaxID=67367 RepID=UPI0036E7F49C